jgi:hypothetical protein
MPTRKKTTPGKQSSASAQVVLRPASGQTIRGDVPITSQNLKDYLPSQENAARVKQFFAGAGFEVGLLVGISFSITAAVELFESTFQTRLRLEERGGVTALGPNRTASYELPLQALPHEIANNIEAVTFTPPIDFGPTPTGPWA